MQNYLFLAKTCDPRMKFIGSSVRASSLAQAYHNITIQHGLIPVAIL